jgi:hypothetical protein
LICKGKPDPRVSLEGIARSVAAVDRAVRDWHEAELAQERER